MSLRTDLLNVVLSDLPDATSTLGEPDPRWDERLGGRTGPNSWSWYERGFGTTCIVTTNGWLIAAGAPDDMVVREPTPNGGGTRMIQAQIHSAEARGWLHTPVRGQLPNFRPGDVYNINHTTSTGDDGTHEGVIISVTPGEDGRSLIVETADGGQGTRQNQSASRSTRVFKLSDGPHPVVVQSPSGPGWLDRWTSIGGAADDDDGDAIPSTEPAGSSAVPALALAGAGLLILAGTAWTSHGGIAHVERAMAELMVGRV